MRLIIGSKEKNKHSNKKLHSDWNEGKTIVAGIKDRDGFVQEKVINDTSQNTLERMILQTVEPKTIIYTDEHRGYIRLACYGL